MLRHTCLRNEHNIVVTKETLSRQSYHIEGKKNVATKKYDVATQGRMIIRSSGCNRQLLAAIETCNKIQNSVMTQLLGHDRENNLGLKFRDS